MNDALVVRRVRGKGRGVFAGRPFRRGEVIEVCPVIPLTRAEADACADTVLDDYFFEWGPRGTARAVALGYGELYNHSPDPNAAFATRTRRLELVFRARRPIRRGEEITIDYGWPTRKGMPAPRA
ncbi:MAG TPA: SET domain-containing protein [Gemmataceae bacterium]|jgi:hypothetical protein